ncbi:methylesterase 17 isoform X2 [Cryptomeria japonica]|uniref:methylesterase 17 isoform X2 n=1 Tax=Cryptomeria japonica TaxID=3369 RepID=UPI0025ACF161|nr:methylesterase 17 isoform X2 [Cryptomeria japonica]
MTVDNECHDKPMTVENGCHDKHGKFHFVLIHGAGHGAWCWYKIVHLLQNAGHKVVLVGHSAGGLSLSHAIHVFGYKIAVAVFIAATMLPSGFFSEQDVQLGVPDLLKVSEFHHGLGPEHPPTTSKIIPEFQRETLYQLSPPEDAALASLLIRPAPLLAFQTAKFHEESDEFLKVPRVYMKTLQDRVILLEKQEAMIKLWPPDNVLSMDTDHSPFFSSPLELHTHLLQIAQLFP